MAFDTLLHRGEIRRFLKDQKNPEKVRKELERLYETAAPVHGVRIDEKYTIIENKLGFQILKNSDIVWVYHLNTKAKLYGVVTTGSFHAVALRTEDGGDHRALTMGTNGAQELLQYLFPRLPQAFFGYSDEIVQVWNQGVQKQGKHADMRMLGMMQHQKARRG